MDPKADTHREGALTMAPITEAETRGRDVRTPQDHQGLPRENKLAEEAKGPREPAEDTRSL